jgi:hypothetical protein
VLEVLSKQYDDLINKLVEVLLEGSVHVRDWTSQDRDVGHIGGPEWD